MITEIALGIFVLLFTVRMVLAPYWISQDQDAKSKAEETRLKQQLAEAQQRGDDRARRSEITTNIGLFLQQGTNALHQFVVSYASEDCRQELNRWYQATYSYLRDSLSIAHAEAFRAAPPVMGLPDGLPFKNGGTYQATMGKLSCLVALVNTLTAE